MTRRRLTGSGMPIDGIETHYAHQSSDMFPVDSLALTLQPRGYLACPVEWCGQVLTINQLHKSQILLRDPNWLVIQAGAADVQQPTLAYY